MTSTSDMGIHLKSFEVLIQFLHTHVDMHQREVRLFVDRVSSSTTLKDLFAYTVNAKYSTSMQAFCILFHIVSEIVQGFLGTNVCNHLPTARAFMGFLQRLDAHLYQTIEIICTESKLPPAWTFYMKTLLTVNMSVGSGSAYTTFNNPQQTVEIN